MNIALSNSVLLPLLALVAVPLLVHLFARARPPVFKFSSIEFLQRVIRKTQRLRKPQDWILWLLRTLAVAALALLFLRPLLFGAGGGSAGEARHVVLVVDASASMACTEGAQSRFAAACAEAAQVLRGLGRQDTANIVWLRAPPVPEFPAPNVNLAHLRDALRRARVSSEPGDIAGALRMAADMLEGREGRRQIVVVSDFQRSAWSDARPPAAPGIAVSCIRVARGDGDNGAVARLLADPAAPLAGETVTLHAEVRNFSAQSRRVPVFLEAGEQRDRREVQIDGWGQASIPFAVRLAAPEELPATVRVGEDAFDGDNARRILLRARPRLRAGLLAGTPVDAGYWRRALEAVGWAEVESLGPDDLARFDGDALLLCGWDGRPAGVVESFAARGGAVIWYPADTTPPEAWARLTGAPPAPVARETAREPFALAAGAVDDPVFAIFAGGEHGDPSSGLFTARLRLPTLPPSASVLLAYRDGVPALARLRDPAPIVLWNLTLDPAHSAWAARPEFLPLLSELALTSRRAGGGAAADEFLPGQLIVRDLAREALAGEVRCADEAGAERAVERREREGGPALFAAGRAVQPGLLAWQVAGEPAGYSVVNFPASESDLRPGDGAGLAARGATFASGRDAAGARDGRPLWPLLLALAGLFLAAEGAVTWWSAKPS